MKGRCENRKFQNYPCLTWTQWLGPVDLDVYILSFSLLSFWGSLPDPTVYGMMARVLMYHSQS